MEHAMNTAHVGVFILSPEFPVRTWTMIELLCFQRREKEAIENGMPVPKLIPVFYRLSVGNCRNASMFSVANELGENVVQAEKFLDRLVSGNTTAKEIVDAIRLLSMRTGVENNAKITNADTDEMEIARRDFIDLIASKVEIAIRNSGTDDDAIRYWRSVQASSATEVAPQYVQPSQDSFTPHFEVWQNPQYVYLSMYETYIPGAAQTPEAEVRDYLLNGSTVCCTVVAIQGMPGVGKTCTLRALCHDPDIRTKFPDGVYVIQLGADASLESFIADLIKAVGNSGGFQHASDMKRSENAESAVEIAMKWFRRRTILFLLDDLWSTLVRGGVYIENLSRVCASGSASALAFSTREKELLMHKSVSHKIVLNSYDPRGFMSRCILLKSIASNETPKFSPLTELAFTELLDSCGGLPVALAVTGRTICKMAMYRENDYNRAIRAYCKIEAIDSSRALDEVADDYTSLSSALRASLRVLETIRMDDAAAPSHVVGPYGEKHSSLSVLQSQQWAPVSMLRRLWDLPTEKEAGIVADKFSDVGLVDIQFKDLNGVEVKGIRLHDLVHEFATRNAARFVQNGTCLQTNMHVRLLNSYSAVEMRSISGEDGCRRWWEAEKECDNYVEENIVRHLMKSGNVEEAVLLVTRPQWIARQLDRNGILACEIDNALLRRHIEGNPDSVTEPGEKAKGLYLVLMCIRLGANAILNNPREVFFQLFARLLHARQSSSFVQMVATYAEKNAYTPCLTAVNMCVQQASDTEGNFIRCNRAYKLSVNEDTGAIVVGCDDGKVAVFDIESRERIAGWEAFENSVTYDLTCEFSKDKRRLVTVSDNTAKVWDSAEAFAEVAVCDFPNPVKSIDICENNRHFVAGDDDGVVSVWNLESGRCDVPVLGRHKRQLICDRRSQDGRVLETGAQMRGVESVALSPSGQLVASGNSAGAINLWRMSSGGESDSTRRSVPEEEEQVPWLTQIFRQFLGKIGLQGGSDSSVHSHRCVSESTDQSCVATLEGHLVGVGALCFTRDGKRLLSGSRDGTLRLWDVEGRCQIGNTVSAHQSEVLTIGLSSDQQEIFSIGRDGAICFFNGDWRPQFKRRVWFAEEYAMTDAKVVASGETMVWSDGNRIQISDLTSSPQSPVFSGNRHRNMVISLCMTPDRSHVISGSLDDTLMVWDTETGLKVGKTLEGHNDTVCGIAVTPDGLRIVSVSWDRTVRVWDLYSQEQIAVFQGQRGWMLCVQVSLDGKMAITGSEDKIVRIWDLEACDGRHRVLEGHSSEVKRLCLAQDGLHFVSISNAEVILWDMDEAAEVNRLETAKDAYLWAAYDLEVSFAMQFRRDSTWRICDLIARPRWNHLCKKLNQIVWIDGDSISPLLTLDSDIRCIELSPSSNTVCVGLVTGHVGIFRVKLDDGDDAA